MCACAMLAKFSIASRTCARGLTGTLLFPRNTKRRCQMHHARRQRNDRHTTSRTYATRKVGGGCGQHQGQHRWCHQCCALVPKANGLSGGAGAQQKAVGGTVEQRAAINKREWGGG